MAQVIDKKHIFECRLKGKPIVIDLMSRESRRNYKKIRKLLYECGVFAECEVDSHGRNRITTHEIQHVVPRDKRRMLQFTKKGHKWREEEDPRYLP